MATSDAPASNLNVDSSLHDEQPISPPNPLPPSLAGAAPTVPDVVSSSTRTSFTRVDYDEDDHRNRPSTSHEPLPPLPAIPTPPETSAHAVELEAPPLISSPSEVKPESPPAIIPTPLQEHVEPVPQTPQTYITFLLITSRRRTMSFEPETTIGRVKELAWNSWPGDWQDERPPAPSYLRVLYLGRMLQDDETLTKLKLPTFTPLQPPPPPSSPNAPTPTIMHLSIRPYPLPGEGDTLKKKKRRGQDGDPSTTAGMNDGDGGTGCCRCVIC